MDLDRLAYSTRHSRYRRALWWLTQGIDVVPLKPHSKHLHPGFGANKQHITDDVAASRWFQQTGANLGVVLGSDRGLVIADWDDAQAYEKWRETLGAQVRTRTEKTARGYHLFFFGKGLRSAVGGGCELLAHGACMVTSSVHPAGVIYRLIDESLIATLDTAGVQELFPFLSNKRATANTQENIAHDGLDQQRRSGQTPAKRGVVAQIKAARSTVAEIVDAGIRLRSGGENALVGLCPFHEDHHPSLWVNPQSGLWGCNKPSCVAAGIHDVINFRAMRKGISNRDAIRALAKEYL